MLRKLVSLDNSFTHLVWSVDSREPCWRYSMFPGYKGDREYDGLTPTELAEIVEPYLRRWGVPLAYCAGQEADDCLATLAKRCSTAGLRCTIATRDKDLLQCCAFKGVRVYWPEKEAPSASPGKPRTVYVPIDAMGVVQRLGVQPAFVPDWKVLAGVKDGLPRVGWTVEERQGRPAPYGYTEARAAEVIAEHGGLEAIYEDRAQLPAREREWLELRADQMAVLLAVARLRTDVPLPAFAEAGLLSNINLD
jgi:5'-3' exonuclease